MAADPKKAGSAYDFLYADLQRIGVILTQFGEDGVLTELVREAMTGTEGSHALDAKIYKYTTGDSGGSGLTRRFDPQWLLPLRLLDLINDRLRRSIASAALGDFVLVKGSLWLLDTGLLQSLYRPDSNLRNIALARGMERASAAGAEFDYDQGELELDMVAHSPRQVQFRLHTSEGMVWSTLRATGLVTPQEELAAKHGVVVDGVWHVVGIKDANARKEPPDDAEESALTAQVAGQFYTIDMMHLAEGMKRIFGRPHNAYGVTPLMIFRPTGQ